MCRIDGGHWRRYHQKIFYKIREESSIQVPKASKEPKIVKEVESVKEELPPKVSETPISERIEELKQDVKAAEENQQILQDVKKGYSNKVDDAIIEIENLLKGEEN